MVNSNLDLDMERELLEADKSELEAGKLELQADKLEFKAEKLEFEATTKGAAKVAEQLEFKFAKAKLEEEKLLLRVAQSQLKAAQSQLEAAKFRLETAHTQLEKAREQLETARKQLEDAKAQTDIDNLRLEAAKASLEAAKMRYEAAGKQLNAAKSWFEAAKIRLDTASSRIEADKVHLEEDKAALEIKVSKVESEKAKLEIRVSQLENENFELVSQLKERNVQFERLSEKMKGVEKQLCQCNEDKKTLLANRTNNPKVFFDITINGVRAGRIVIELDMKTTPLTAENFRVLCTGEKGIGRTSGKPLHYKGSRFYRILPGENTIQGGDITRGDGLGGDSMYGPTFPVENLIKKHDGPGIVSTAHVGDNPRLSNGSRFLISTAAAHECDAYNVVFGRVAEGMNVVMAMKNAGSGANCVIADCGQLS